jgi:hypothetical protein
MIPKSFSSAALRLLCASFNAQPARAIFHAARKEHSEARILLRRGTRTVADSAD